MMNSSLVPNEGKFLRPLITSQIRKGLPIWADTERTADMGRSGINTERALGVSMPLLRQTAKKLGKSHSLELELWASGIHEARILACLVE